MGYLPKETVVKPRSRCPSCGHGITALENIPVASYLALRGKCSACKAPIGIRYPVVEAFSGLMAGAIAWKFGPTVQCAGALLLFFWLLPLALIDAETTYLANETTLPLLWIGLIFNVFGVFAPLGEAVVGAVVGYLFLAIPAFTMEWLRNMDTTAMGRGDFVLMAVAGAWFGWTAILPVVLLSSCVGVAVYLPMRAAGLRDKASRIPFGPYIAGATAAYLFAGAWLKDFIGLPF
jgi:leader peptidase (prepilin peptidase)/N-methyltransferase